jgi:arginine deiminase
LAHVVQPTCQSASNRLVPRVLSTHRNRRQVIEHMSVTQLIDIILINPTVTLTPSGRDTGLTASYTFEPMSNLVYTRDQQVRCWRSGPHVQSLVFKMQCLADGAFCVSAD